MGIQHAFVIPALCYLFIAYYGLWGSKPSRSSFGVGWSSLISEGPPVSRRAFAFPAGHISRKSFQIQRLLRFLLTCIANAILLLQFAIGARRIKPLIAGKIMKLGEKIRYLREVEGSLRGLDRAMSQLELVRAIETETGSKLSQSYLSQIESGARPHLTNTTRQLLAKFFKVHPGYLVDDPDGYSPELQSELRNVEDKLDLWLVAGAERFRRDPELMQALLVLARHEHSRAACSCSKRFSRRRD